MLVAVVPAFNEEKKIGPVIRDLFNQVDKVIVVDDASVDSTFVIAKKSGAFVLQHKINRGQGASLQTGHEYALKIGADYVVDFDADGQHNVLDIKMALKKLKEEKVDILFGSRFLDKRSNLPFSKKYFILPLGKLVNFLFGTPFLKDPQNGFRIFTREALEKINIKQDRMAHATEILAQVKKNRLKFIEFPVEVVYSEYGQGVIGGFKIIQDLFFGIFSK